MNGWQKPPWISTFILLYHKAVIKWLWNMIIIKYSYNDKYIHLDFLYSFVFYSCIHSGLTNAAMEQGLLYQSSLHYIYTHRLVLFPVYLSKCKQVTAFDLKWCDVCSSSLCWILNPSLHCISWKIKLFKDVLPKPTSQRECSCVEFW